MNLLASQHSSRKSTKAIDPAPTLHVRKQQVVRDAIWDAATDLFFEQGFDETTVDDIAQAAGISRRSFFRYFASKSDLMAHGMVSYGAEITAAIDSCPRTHSLSEVFRETVLQVAQKSTGHPRTCKIMAILAKYPAARAAELSRFAEVQELVSKAYVKRCKKQGEDTLTASILAGMTLQVAGVTVRWWFEQGQPDISSVVEKALATIGRLLCNDKPLGRRKRQIPFTTHRTKSPE